MDIAVVELEDSRKIAFVGADNSFGQKAELQ